MKTLKNLTAGLLAVALVFAVTSSPSFATEKNKKTPKPAPAHSKVEVAKVLDSAFAKATWMTGIDKYETLENVSLGYAQIEDFEKALEAANAIEVPTHKINALLWLSKVQARNGNKEECTSLMTNALLEAHKMNNTLQKAQVFEALSNEFSCFDNVVQSKSLQKQAKMIRKIVEIKSKRD